MNHIRRLAYTWSIITSVVVLGLFAWVVSSTEDDPTKHFRAVCEHRGGTIVTTIDGYLECHSRDAEVQS